MKFKCADCGHEPEGNKQGEWKVQSAVCPKCGGEIRIDFDYS